MSETNSVNRRMSRFNAGGVTEVAQNRLEWWERSTFSPDANDRIYQVEMKFQGRIDLIAALFLGESRYWWIIAQYNSILDPYSEISEGKILYIPSSERVSAILGGTTTGGVPSTREVRPSILPIV